MGVDLLSPLTPRGYGLGETQGGSASDPLKAIISLLEASKRSGGLLEALTCYLFYLHPKISDPQLIQYDPFNCVLVSLLYILYGSM